MVKFNNNLGNKETMSENIKYYMQLHNKTRNEMCEILDVKYSTFADWVNAKKYPRIDKIERMANYFGIMKSDLVEKRDSLTELPPESIVFNDYFPLHYCINLSGGSFDEILEAEPDAVVYVPIVFQSKRKRLHAFQINGTSMNNVFPDHSIVVVEDSSGNIKYKDGTIVVAYHGGEATVKRFYAKEDGIVLMPDSSDKSHLPIVIPNDEQLLIFGHVIWHMNPEDVAKYY